MATAAGGLASIAAGLLALAGCGGPTQPSPAASPAALQVFGASDREHGREVWVTNGTAAGTRLLADIRNGAAASDPRDFTRLGSRTLFTAADDALDASGRPTRNLWVTDGTAAETRMVRSFGAGGESSVENLVAFKNLGFFTARDAYGRQIWRTDGTAAGTTRVTNIQPDHTPRFSRLTNLDDRVLFFVTGGVQLWATDGTEAGTRVLPVDATLMHSPLGAHGVLYFGQDRMFFRSDGSPEGTWPFKLPRLWLDTTDGVDSALGAAAGSVFLAVEGNELWRSDGTLEGTSLLGDLRDSGGVRGFAALGRTLLVFGGEALYASDGTFGGTQRVAAVGRPSASRTVGPWLYFTVPVGNAPASYDLWRTDGSAAGTLVLGRFRGTWDVVSESAGGQLTFVVGSVENELWQTDGTPGGSLRIVVLGAS